MKHRYQTGIDSYFLTLTLDADNTCIGTLNRPQWMSSMVFHPHPM